VIYLNSYDELPALQRAGNAPDGRVEGYDGELSRLAQDYPTLVLHDVELCGDSCRCETDVYRITTAGRAWLAR
jgi:hypothetical protein